MKAVGVRLSCAASLLQLLQLVLVLLVLLLLGPPGSFLRQVRLQEDTGASDPPALLLPRVAAAAARVALSPASVARKMRRTPLLAALPPPTPSSRCTAP